MPPCAHAASHLALLLLLRFHASHSSFGLHDAGLQVIHSAHGIVHLIQRDANSRVHLRRKAARVRFKINAQQLPGARASSCVSMSVSRAYSEGGEPDDVASAR